MASRWYSNYAVAQPYSPGGSVWTESWRRTYLLDGDNIRQGLSDDLGFAPGDRAENVRRVGQVARMFADGGVVALVSLVAIDHLVRRLEADDRGWGEFFAAKGLEPLRISYESDLEPGGEGAVRRVLARVGLDPPEGFKVRKLLQRQSDALSDEWVAAYHRDAAS